MAVVVEVGPSGEEAATWTTARGSSTSWVGCVKRCVAGVKDCVSPGFCVVTGCGWSDRGRVAGSKSSVGGVLRTTFLLTGLSGTESSMVDDGEKSVQSVRIGYYSENFMRQNTV